MTLRLAVATDLPELAQMRWDFRAEDGEVPHEDQATFLARYHAALAPGLASGAWTYWVAEADSQLVAHMAIQTIPAIPRPARAHDRWGYLTDCYTRPSYRSRGIGSALLRAVVTWAQSQDLELLLVSPSIRATPWYQREGFRPADDFLCLPLRPFDIP